MIEAARRAIDEEGASRSTELLVVTVLTSMGESTLKEIGFTGTVIENVVRLANLAADAGADGVVASAQEVGAIKSSSEGKLKVICPGVRPVWARRKGDQKRVVTPEDAARSGADHIVVGRPIIDNADPQEAAFAIIRELERAQLS